MPGGLTWLFIGQPKTAKTTQSAKWSEKGKEGVLVLDANLGADLVEGGCNRIPITSINPPREKIFDEDGNELDNSEEPIIPAIDRGYYHRTGPDKGKPMEVWSMAEVLVFLKKNWDKLPYDTVTIDTVGDINDWIEDIVKKELNISSIGEAAFGADWGMARRKNVDILGKFQRFLVSKGATLVLVGHSKITSIVDGQSQLQLALPAGLARTLAGGVDVIGYTTISKETGEPEITFSNYQERQIGSRLRPLFQRTVPFSYEAVKEVIVNYEKEKNGE